MTLKVENDVQRPGGEVVGNASYVCPSGGWYQNIEDGTMTALTLADILPPVEYARSRTAWKQKIAAIKRDRRVAIGPYVTFYFESRDTMWLQVQEMIYIEKGGMEQAAGELTAYNPLIPNGSELVATFMIEIDDPIRRQNVLANVGGIEETAFIRIGGEMIAGIAEPDQDRTREDGKASSVQFVHFPFTPAQIAAFKSGEGEAILGFTHPRYGHMAVIVGTARVALGKDFS
jgi:hypothetical protein